MDKIKRFIECYIPTETCNLRCHYCYITQQRKFNNKLISLTQSKETIRAALSKERMGGVCLINFCAGGETLLSAELLAVVRELLSEGHYVMVVTNGTLTNRFEEIATWGKELLSRLFFKFSFHFLELKRLGWLDRFFENVERMKESGASFTVEVTPSDELIPYIDELKSVCMERLGALCHITVARDDRTDGIDHLSVHDFETYQKIWGQFDSLLFDFKASIFYHKRREFCYAGDWSVHLNLETGVLRQCYCGRDLGNIYEDPSAPLQFEAIGCKCSFPHCYNGHAFLTLGVIPELETPFYGDVRDRVTADGSRWLGEQMSALMHTKLAESNREYTQKEKTLLRRKDTRRRVRAKLSASVLGKVVRKLKGR